MSKQIFRLVHDQARQNAARACMTAPEGFVVEIKEPTRSLDQSAKFHAICGDIARQRPFAGSMRKPEIWKVILISGHAAATKQGSEMAPGLEGEWLNLREPTAKMSVKRMASLIEYALAYCAMNDIVLSGPPIEPPEGYR